MTIIEQIKAEIERLYNGEAPKHDQQCNFDDGYFTGIDAIAQFIDTLESEKPMNQEGLDQEIIKCWQNWLSPSNQKEVEGVLPKTEFAMYARHFAKWGEHNALKHLHAARRTEEAYQEVAKEMRKQIAESGSSEIPNDLEEAAKRYSNNKHPMTPTGARESQENFIAGAKWDREQIMKNAKDGWMDEEDVIILNDGTRIDLQPDYDKKPAFEFEYAQNVQVIVLPKES